MTGYAKHIALANTQPSK